MSHAVIGIGNPGAEYDGTYHNAGAMLVRELAGDDACWTARPGFRYCKRDDVVYAVTDGYMNESGRGVASLLGFFKIPAADMILAHDDTDQELGCVRMRRGGGAGGHRGVASVIASLGTDAFWRLKIGARPARFSGEHRVKAAGFVLSRFGDEEAAVLYGETFPAAAKLVSNVIENEMPSGPERTSVTGRSTRASDGSASSDRLKESS